MKSPTKFSHLENNIAGATIAIAAEEIAMWFIHISINGLFLQETEKEFLYITILYFTKKAITPLPHHKTDGVPSEIF